MRMGVRMKIGKVCLWVGIILFEIMITTKQVLTMNELGWPKSTPSNTAYTDPLWTLMWIEAITLTFFALAALLMLRIGNIAKKATLESRFASLQRLHAAVGIVAGAVGIIVGLRPFF